MRVDGGWEYGDDQWVGVCAGGDGEVLESSGSSLATTFVSGTQLKVVAPAHAAGR